MRRAAAIRDRLSQAGRFGATIRALWPLAALVAGAAYYAFGVLWMRAQRDLGDMSFDAYTSFYPNIHYALTSLHQGGGLLWNPYQDCGQPFFAESLTGLLYPV